MKVDFAPKQDFIFLLVAIVLCCSCAKNLYDGKRNTLHDVKGFTYLQTVTTVPRLLAAQHPPLAVYKPSCSIYHPRFLIQTRV